MVGLRLILRDGVGEGGYFFRSHPILNFTYFALVIGITMFSTHPAFLLASFVSAWLYSLVLRGRKALRQNCLIFAPAILLMTFFNTLNVHNGVTVLFYLNGNRITAEAIVFGCVSAILLSSVIVWFRCFSAVVTADKFIYLFGRFAPVLALTLSMILRDIPLLKARFREISSAQRCMGRGLKGSALPARLRQFGKELSILIAWSLEASIDTADSMQARGYGLRGRTSFHLFRFSSEELRLLLLMVLLGAAPLTACAAGQTAIYYYPSIVLPRMTPWQAVSLASWVLLMLLPAALDFREASSWI